MIIERIFTPGLAQVAYLLADDEVGEVAVIDPRRDVQVYLDWATERNLQITSILETHVHADFLSGALELHHATGAPIYSSALGEQEFEHVGLHDGDRVRVGRLELEARWTPGHTPEHIVFLLFDPEAATTVQAMFSGDFIFAGEIGRPDLLGDAHTEALARQLYESLTVRIADMPDDLLVYPGHTAGSSCGRKIGDAVVTTLGAERRFTYAYRFADEQSFVTGILDGMPEPPPYYARMKVVNRVGPKFLHELPTGRALSVDTVAELIEAGGLVIDARAEQSFDRAHIPGSYYAGDRYDFVNWVGWRAPYDVPVVLLLDQDEAYPHFVTELHRIGVDRIAGFLTGGIDAWTEQGRSVDSLQVLSPDRFRAMLAETPDAMLLDVRTSDEWKEGHIDRAVNEFAGDIAAGMLVENGQDRMLMLTCATGYRSRVAASTLQARGETRIVQLDGGMDAWNAAGLPVADQ